MKRNGSGKGWRRIDFTGVRVGRLIPLRAVGKSKLGILWLCRCDCGTETVVPTSSLRTESTKSCGCYRLEVLRTGSITHGQSRTPEHYTYCHMKSRCLNPKNRGYKNYGGRGIQVCERWKGLDGFANFLADVGPKPGQRYSIDRIDVNGHYEPGNVRWALPKVQGQNKRSTRWIVHNGERRKFHGHSPRLQSRSVRRSSSTAKLCWLVSGQSELASAPMSSCIVWPQAGLPMPH
jgi:hypothetical protein